MHVYTYSCIVASSVVRHIAKFGLHSCSGLHSYIELYNYIAIAIPQLGQLSAELISLQILQPCMHICMYMHVETPVSQTIIIYIIINGVQNKRQKCL